MSHKYYFFKSHGIPHRNQYTSDDAFWARCYRSGLLAEHVDLLSPSAVAVWARTSSEHPATPQAAVYGRAGSWTVASAAAVSLYHHLTVTLLAVALACGDLFVLVVVVIITGVAGFRWCCKNTDDGQGSGNERRSEPFCGHFWGSWKQERSLEQASCSVP